MYLHDFGACKYVFVKMIFVHENDSLGKLDLALTKTELPELLRPSVKLA